MVYSFIITSPIDIQYQSFFSRSIILWYLNFNIVPLSISFFNFSNNARYFSSHKYLNFYPLFCINFSNELFFIVFAYTFCYFLFIPRRSVLYNPKKLVSTIKSQNSCGGAISLNVSVLGISVLFHSFTISLPKNSSHCGRNIVFS